MKFLLAALGAVALYFLVVLPWLHRREESVDSDRQRRVGRTATPPRTSPAEVARPGESVESVLTESEARALLGDEAEPEATDPPPVDTEPLPWPTDAHDPHELEPVLGLHTGDVGLATLLTMHLQAEGIPHRVLGQVWGNRQVMVPRRHESDVRRILEDLVSGSSEEPEGGD